MKNHNLLISILILSFISISNANEIKSKEIYEKAKLAYMKPECSDVIYYLQEYLKISHPNKIKLASINSTIQWCRKFLNEGVVVSRVYGIIATTNRKILTKTGIQMLDKKPRLK